jgi:hypothetical protein
MADQLCTPEDLASLLQMDLDRATAELLIEMGTAVVQDAAGMRIVEVIDDPFTVFPDTDVRTHWLQLPEIPVTEVKDVTVNGVAVTDYTLVRGRLWRRTGWLSIGTTYRGQPVEVSGLSSHGYPEGSQDLQLARGSVLSIIKGAYDNPIGASSEAIDDYKVTYADLEAQMAAAPHLAQSLRTKYGRRNRSIRMTTA